jgi:hypothetical protein
MVHRCETGSLLVGVVNIGRSAAILLVVMGGGISLRVTPAVAGMPRSLPAATYDRLPGDDQHNGNGKFNRNSSPFNSPNNIRGSQTTINANSGGNNISQSGLCKRKVRCRLVQKANAGGW